jgi:putative ABC transport system permease protein
MSVILALVPRAILRRPVRTLLTVVAVSLGIAAVLGVQLARAGLDAQSARAVAERAGASSLDVRVDAGQGLGTEQVKTLASVHGVLQAVPLYEKRVIAAPAGSGFGGVTVTLVGLQDGAAALRPVQVVSGRLPGPDSSTDIAIDQGLAGALIGKPNRQLRLGDHIQLITTTGPDSFRVVGFTTGTSGGPAFTRSAVFASDRLLQSEFQLGLRTPLVALRVSPSVTVASVSAAVHERFGQTVTTSDPTAQSAAPIGNLQPLLALITVLSVIVGAGVTANSVVLAAAERRREIGLLRAAGCSARQVFRLFAVEAVMVATLAVPIGIGAGIGLGALFSTRFAPSDLPVPAVQLSAGITLAAVVAGWGSAVVGAVLPAILAGRLSILEALRSHPRGERERARPALGVAAIACVAAAGICFGFASGAAVALGAVFFLAGVAISLPLTAPLVARLLATLASPLLPGSAVAATNLRRSPNRLALTVSGLAISVACAVGASALAAGALSAGDTWVRQLFVGDVLVRSPVTQLDSVADAIRKNGAVRKVTALRVFSQPVAGAVLGVATIDPSAYEDSSALQVTSGDRTTAIASLEDGPYLLAPEQLALSSGWHAGTQLPVHTKAGTTYFTVLGTVAHSYPAGDGSESVVMASDIARSYFGDTAAGFDDLEVTTAGDAGAVAKVAASYGMQAVAVSDIVAATEQSVDHSVGLLVAVAVIAVTIAMLAVINTLAVSVRARSRDLALLRAVGLGRRQAFRRVLGESALIAATATVIGTAAGCVIAFPMLRASTSPTFAPGFTFPLETALALIGVVILASVVATIGPARRAVGSSVPAALKYE